MLAATWRWGGVAAIAVAGLGYTAWGQEKPAAPAKPRPVRVVATVQPARGIVAPLLEGTGVEASVETLIPPGVSEHGYEVPPSKLAALDGADVVVLVGLGLEPQIEKFLREHPRPGRRVVVLADAAGIKAEDDDDHDHAHQHGPDCDHAHGTDPHIWLDPELVEKMLPAVTASLADAAGAAGHPADAVQRVRLAENAARFRVRGVGLRYRLTIDGAARKTIVVGHDAWGYLARRYGLTTVAIKGLNAQEPTPASLEAAKKAVKAEGLKVVFVEPQLGRAAGKRIADATGAEVRTLDPLGSGDWFAMMEGNLKEIATALGVPVAELPPQTGEGPTGEPQGAAHEAPRPAPAPAGAGAP